MESISKFFKVEKDFLYIKGMEEGVSKRNIAFVQSLIQGTEFDDNKIAELVGVSKDVVREIRTSAKK